MSFVRRQHEQLNLASKITALEKLHKQGGYCGEDALARECLEDVFVDHCNSMSDLKWRHYISQNERRRYAIQQRGNV